MSINKIDLGFSVGGTSNKKEQFYINITRKDVTQRIEKHPAIDPWTKEYLKKRISEYPDYALIYFVNNINQIVINAINERNRVMKEQHDENRKKITACQNDNPVQQPSSGESGETIIADESQKLEKEEEREDFFSKRTTS